MKEIFEIILHEINNDRSLMLVTLTGSDGSAPRKTGAQMLVGREGLICGTIGGGAVEKRSIEMAIQMLAEKSSGQHLFRLRTNDKEDIGMICGGDVNTLFQYIDAEDTVWKEVCEKASQQLYAHRGGWFIQSLSGGQPALLDTSAGLLAGMKPEGDTPETERVQSAGDYFWMPLPVSERVIIFGGGHIAAALVPLLATIGFRTWVFDDRPAFTTRERFPKAEKLITADFAHIADEITITDRDYVVIMTNGHVHDFEAELHVLRGPFTYIGVIGSRKKTAAVNAKLREQGISDEIIAKVHTPIGTPIKAVTPEEIAVSIAGELILTRAERRSASADTGCPMH